MPRRGRLRPRATGSQVRLSSVADDKTAILGGGGGGGGRGGGGGGGGGGGDARARRPCSAVLDERSVVPIGTLTRIVGGGGGGERGRGGWVGVLSIPVSTVRIGESAAAEAFCVILTGGEGGRGEGMATSMSNEMGGGEGGGEEGEGGGGGGGGEGGGGANSCARCPTAGSSVREGVEEGG